MSETTRRVLIWAYAAVGVLTLVYQVDVRSALCRGGIGCTSSYTKGVIWSIAWPAYWVLVHVVGI